MELQKINEALNSYVRPQTFPVAVKMVSSASEIPEKARMPKRDLGVTMPLCQVIAIARRQGWLMAMGKEDMNCPLGALTLGFVPAKEHFLDGSFNIPFWAKSQDVRAQMNQGLPRLEYGKYTYIIVAPLHRADFKPHIIIIYGNPAQLSRLIQSTVYTTGEPNVPSNMMSGFSCGAEITAPILSEQCQVSIAGGGDRTIAQTHDHEAAFTIPMSKIAAVVEGLEETYKIGMRYPVHSFFTYKAAIPENFNKLMDYLTQDD